MKTMNLVLLALTLSTPALAQGLPQGTFINEGSWKSSAGAQGTYVSETTIEGNLMTQTYQGKSSILEFNPTGNGFFDVMAPESDGTQLGFAYCVDKTCRYLVNHGDTTVEESLILEGDKLRAMGSKRKDGFTTAWTSLSR